MGYWDKPDVKKRLKEAYEKIEPYRLAWKPGKKKAKKKIIKVTPQGSFEVMFDWCNRFKSKYHNKDMATKIAELKKMARKKIKNSIPYEKRREKKHYVPPTKKCWVCKGKAQVQHRIILIKNGGYDNGINRIAICNKCHDLIHDWMPMVRSREEMDKE